MPNKQATWFILLFLVCAVTSAVTAFLLFGVQELLAAILAFSILAIFVNRIYINKTPPIHDNAQARLAVHDQVNSRVSKRIETHLFALLLIDRQIELDELSSALKAAFQSQNVSCKLVQTNRVSITVHHIKQRSESLVCEQFELVCGGLFEDYAVGACIYCEPCQQLNVYQLAELSLAMARTRANYPQHTLKLNETSVILLQYSLPEMVSEILNRQFLLTFEPVFSVHGEALLFHQVGFNFRHHKIGLCDVKQFMYGCLEPEKLIELDKHIVELLIKTLKQEPAAEVVSLSIDLATWKNEAALFALVNQICDANLAGVIQFSLNESSLIVDSTLIQQRIQRLKMQGLSVNIEHCFGDIFDFPTLANDLNCLIVDAEVIQQASESEQIERLKAFDDFSICHQLPLFASGITEQTQVNLLKSHRFEGACGLYFQQNVSDFAFGFVN